ncbi:MAG TPA: 2-dehydropantoate 2-reductase [Ramlibacter sp.]|nr:2-dehydropantoate 2-reductase [Ramlibacter sp.]
MLKVCIFGGGAIGGHLAGHLARAGLCEVSVVARGATLAALRENGLSVTTPAGSFQVHVHATDDPASLGPQDYLFLTLKAHQVEDALDQLRPLVGPQTAILPPTTAIPYYFFHGGSGDFRNRRLPGVDPQGRQWEALPPEQVLGCVYWIGAHSSAPGVVVQDGAKAGCPLGELDGSESPRVRRLSELLTASGIEAKVNADIRAAIWMKFVNSLCWNPVAVLTLATLGEIGADPAAAQLVETMMNEADALATRLGLQLPQPPAKRIKLTLSAPRHKMSMLQDLEHGRPLELAALAQSLAAVRELAGLPTPTLDAVLALAMLRAQTHSPNEHAR